MKILIPNSFQIGKFKNLIIDFLWVCFSHVLILVSIFGWQFKAVLLVVYRMLIASSILIIYFKFSKDQVKILYVGIDFVSGTDLSPQELKLYTVNGFKTLSLLKRYQYFQRRISLEQIHGYTSMYLRDTCYI